MLWKGNWDGEQPVYRFNHHRFLAKKVNAMSSVQMSDLLKFLSTNRTASELLSHSGTVPPIYISFGTPPDGIEILTEEFRTPEGIGNMFVDIGSDGVVYGIEFIA